MYSVRATRARSSRSRHACNAEDVLGEFYDSTIFSYRVSFYWRVSMTAGSRRWRFACNGAGVKKKQKNSTRARARRPGAGGSSVGRATVRQSTVLTVSKQSPCEKSVLALRVKLPVVKKKKRRSRNCFFSIGAAPHGSERQHSSVARSARVFVWFVQDG